MNVMIDIETFGTNSNSPILSIGAVKFDKELGEEFLVNVTVKSNLDSGAVIDGETVDWWLKRDMSGLATPEPIHIENALSNLSTFIGDNKKLNVWANGTSFDMTILKNAYLRCGMYNFPKFFQWMCMRSIRNLGWELGLPYGEFKKENNADVHNALADAVCQAKYVLEVYKKAGVDV